MKQFVTVSAVFIFLFGITQVNADQQAGQQNRPKLVFFDKLPVSLQAGVGYWMESPDAVPEGWHFRQQANIVLPKSMF